MSSKVYKWCAVPLCKNTSIATPNKLFIYVPNKKLVRDKWLQLARRDPTDVVTNSTIYFCEDHFDLPNDMENYMQYHVLGSVSQVRMKPGCIPKTFACQQEGNIQSSDSIQQPYLLKKRKKLTPTESKKQLDPNCMVTLHIDFEEIATGSSVQHNLKETPQQVTSKLMNKSIKNGASSQKENEIKIFCPKCDSEVSHSSEGIQEDQTKVLVAKVYHYLEQEYKELKEMYKMVDLSPLSRFSQRTALATGVSEETVLQILEEEEARKAKEVEEPRRRRRTAQKRPSQRDSSIEDSSDDNEDEGEQSGTQNEPEIETCTVKMESPEELQMDPISVDVKTEPRDDEENSTNDAPMIRSHEPALTKRRIRKKQRTIDVTIEQHTGEPSTAHASSTAPLTRKLDENSLFGEREIKIEEIEIHEEGFS